MEVTEEELNLYKEILKVFLNSGGKLPAKPNTYASVN